jgi:hypothetical protein
LRGIMGIGGEPLARGMTVGDEAATMTYRREGAITARTGYASPAKRPQFGYDSERATRGMSARYKGSR